MPFAATWMDLGIIKLSKVSQKKTDIWDHLSMKSKKKTNRYKWTSLQNRNGPTNTGNKLSLPKGKRWGGINYEFGINLYTLLYIK